MPASQFTRKASTPKLKRQWQHVYDSEKARGASPKDAVIRANGVVKRQSHRGSRRTKRKTSR